MPMQPSPSADTSRDDPSRRVFMEARLSDEVRRRAVTQPYDARQRCRVPAIDQLIFHVRPASPPSDDLLQSAVTRCAGSLLDQSRCFEKSRENCVNEDGPSLALSEGSTQRESSGVRIEITITEIREGI